MGGDNDHSGIGGEVTHGTHESDDEGQDHGRDVAQLVIEQSHDQAALFAHTDGQRHSDNETEGSKSGEVLDQILEEPGQAGGGEGVLNGNDFAGGGVDSREPQQGADAAGNGNDNEQINEHDCGRGELVTGALQEIQELVKPVLLCKTVCRWHNFPS